MESTSHNDERNASNTDPGSELGKAGNEVIDEAGRFGGSAIDKATDFFNGGASSNDSDKNDDK